MKTTDTQRIGYFDGQLLAARDLQDDADRESRLRGLHVRALHNTWGVALGFAASRRDGNVIQIGPGVAYDCYGREIISARTTRLGLPPAPGQSSASAWMFDLVISYRDREDFAAGRECQSPGFSPLEERPDWSWRFAGDLTDAGGVSQAEPDRVRLGEEIPLVRVEFNAEGEIIRLDDSVRRNAQGLVRPHIAGDQQSGVLEEVADLGAYSITVDTSQAGFSRTPYYFARVTLPGLLSTALDPEVGGFLRALTGPFVSVRSPQRDSFRLDVRFAVPVTDVVSIVGGVPSVAELLDILAESPSREGSILSAEVNWLGIESNGGCAPPLDVSYIFLFLSPILTDFGGFTGFTSGRLAFGGSDL